MISYYKKNPYRAEMRVTLSGNEYVLRLTLQALAEIEDAFKVDGVSNLGARFSKGGFSTNEIISLFCAMVRGGGRRY